MLVVPCYNEAERLDTDAFVQFLSTAPTVRVLFVNDGSKDGTGEVLERLRERCPESVSIERLVSNSGKGEAVRIGINKALERSPAFVGYWDADLSTPLDQVLDFRNLLLQLPEVIAVLGSRVRRLGANVQRRAARHYLGRIFATCASMVLGLAVYDTQCGAKLFRATDVVKQAFATPFLSRWIFDVEILARISSTTRDATSRTMYEFPVPAWRDVGGSKVKASSFLIAFMDLFRIRKAYRRGR